MTLSILMLVKMLLTLHLRLYLGHFQMGAQTRTHCQDFVQVLSGLSEPLSVREPTLGIFCLFQLPDIEHYVDLQEKLLSFRHHHENLFSSLGNMIGFVGCLGVAFWDA